jgi:hypothetical protein
MSVKDDAPESSSETGAAGPSLHIVLFDPKHMRDGLYSARFRQRQEVTYDINIVLENVVERKHYWV